MKKEQVIGLWATLCKALSLRAEFYDDARSTPKSHRTAFTIVLLAAVSHTLGSAVILLINRAALPHLLLALAVNGLSVVGGYYAWTWMTWQVGQLLKVNAPSYRELLVPIGFAYAPQTLNVLTLIPLLGRPIGLVLAAWSLLAVIVAVREGLDIRARRAVLICAVGWTFVQLAIGAIQILSTS
ncbi:MAG: hypothetical protein Kow00121_62440 [Elainellaceae cyanobacterium]